MSEIKDNKGLFQGVRFYTMGDLNKEVKEILIKGKAKAESYLSALVTHAIVSDFDHYEVEAARDMWQVPTVTPEWVMMSLRCQKLLPTNGFLASKDQIFSNIVASFSNLPEDDKYSLWALITYYGGQCQKSLSPKCTHLVTPLTTGAKYDTALSKTEIKIVAPDWITDSVKLKKTQLCEKYHPQLNVVPSPIQVKSSPKEVVSDTIEAVQSMSVKESPEVKMDTSNEPNSLSKIEEISTVQAKTTNNATSIASDAVTAAKLAPQSTTKVNISSTAEQTKAAIRHSTPQFKPVGAATHPGFAMPNSTSMRPPLPTSVAGHALTQTPSALQIHPGMTSNHNPPPTMMMSEQQHNILPPTSPYMVVSSAVSRASGSPRRNSSQSSGGKKKKSGGALGATRPPMPSPGHQSHLAFQGNVQGVFTSQQQQMMMQKMRMEQMAPGQTILDGGVNNAAMVGPRFVGMAGNQARFPNPSMMIPQHSESSQHIRQQQMLQQQQHLQRMAIMRQTPPGSVQVVNQMDAMQGKWPRQAMENPNFQLEQHQQFYPHSQPASNAGDDSQSMQMPVQSHMAQAMPISAQQTSQASRFNPAMMNRFPNQMNQQQKLQQQQQQQLQQPQQQQQHVLYQQMQQQQHHQQHHAPVRFPNPTSLEAAGISGISPIALQQGLLNAEKKQADQPPLIHPSLQGLSPKVSTSSQSVNSSTSQKKRAKSRKKTDVEEEGKSKPRPRSNKAKKPTTPLPASAANINQMQSQINVMTSQHFSFEGRMMTAVNPASGYPGMPHPPLDPSFNPASFPVNQNQFQAAANISKPPINNENVAPARPISAPTNEQLTNHTSIQQPPPKSIDSKDAVNQQVPTKDDEKMKTKPATLLRSFIDPLTFKVEQLESDYVTRELDQPVTDDLFLLGCVFHITEYDAVVNDISVIGNWKSIIEKYGGIVEEQYSLACTHLICATCTTSTFKQALSEGKRCITIYWLNDVLQLKALRVPWLALHAPTQFGLQSKPATNQMLTYSNFHSKERERIKMMAFVCGAKLTGYMSRLHTALICKTTEGLKHDKAKSWSVPCINTLWLRDVMQGQESAVVDFKLEKYQRTLTANESLQGFLLDIEKAQHLLSAWKTPISVTQDSLDRTCVIRNLNPIPSGPSESKRPRLELNRQPCPRVFFTGLPSAVVQDLKTKLESLNGRVETSYALCTHLVTKNISRTLKFLTCISFCSYVVSPQWIENSFKQNCFLDERNYFVKDKAEEDLHFSLVESLRRAKKAPLFKDCLFFITSSVTPDLKTMRQIIECGGGRVLNKIPSLSVFNHMKSRVAPERNIIIISCPEDEKVYKPLKKEGLVVHNAEIVLTGVLKQEINLNAYRL